MIKIIQNDKVIDVVKYPRYVKFVSEDKIAITNKSLAQGVVGSDTTSIYSFTPVTSKVTGVATIAEITQDEYDQLAALLELGKTVSADEDALADAKLTAIKALSDMCHSKILSGFSVSLSDGESYRFRLTVEDQLNLLMLENQLNAGEKTFVYHATDCPCAIFSRTDMIKIIAAFRRHTLYHTTYFNAVKRYIKSLLNIEEVMSFTYGTDISDTVDDPAVRYIIKTGGQVL